MSIQDKKNKRGPRKLLALDGGGIRGIVTLEVLAEIEGKLQNELGRGDDFVLADYFDYIGGTSTGAIIATCLSLGMRVGEISDFYSDNGSAMFDKAGWLGLLTRNKFRKRNLAKKLQSVIAQETGESEAKLGSEALRTYLLLVLRNATTDSPWPISNNPEARYNDRSRPDCNLDFPLWQLVRASTAAPVYFPPEVITVGTRPFVFVDGGVTMFNNPAFQLFLMATIKPYRLQWPASEDTMLLVSIGTGTAADANENLRPWQMNHIYNVRRLPAAFMFAASNQQDLLCRVFGKCLNGGQLDRELLNLREDDAEGRTARSSSRTCATTQT